MKLSMQFNRIFSIVLSLVIVLSTLVFGGAVTASAVNNVWDGSKDTTFEGSGTAEAPYKITSAAELYGFVKTYCVESSKTCPDNLYFELTTDIYLNDVSNSNWMNSGAREWVFNNTWTTNGNYAWGFRGNFNGNGHTVYGMYYENPNDYAAVSGLFPYVSGNAVISNINIKHSYVKASNYWLKIGGIVGIVNKNPNGTASNVTISKCVADDTNDFSGLTNALAGGIVGPIRESNVTLEYCGSAVKFNSSSNPASAGGGLAARLNDMAAKSITINNCYSVAAFSLCNPSENMKNIAKANILYSDHAWWNTQGVALTYKAKTGWVGANAYFNLKNLDWDVWQANDGAFPTIKGSTNYIKTEDSTEGIDVWDGTIAVNYAGGTGTVTDPYLISTPEQLKRLTLSHVINDIIGGNEEGKYYAFTNDIYLNDISDFNADEWLVNGADKNWRDMNLINRQINNASKGLVAHIDGNGYTVYGLYYLETEEDLNNSLNLNAGLFFNMGVGSSITDLHIRKSLVYGKYAGAFIGSIGSEAGFATDAGTITLSGCSVDDSVGVYGLKTGGLVGVAQANFVVENCYSSAIVGGDSSYGGVYGDAWNGGGANHTFRNVYTTNAYPIALTTSGSQGRTPSEGCRSYENVYSIFTHESYWEGIESVSSFEEMTGLSDNYWYGTEPKLLINRGIKTHDINADDSDKANAADIVAMRKLLLIGDDEYDVICDCNNDNKFDIIDLVRLKKIVSSFFA